jgi:uncharacterized membrane protein (GlpM family)
MFTQGSPELQESKTKQKSTVCIIGMNKIAPNFVTLVATYIFMSFSFLKTSQRNIHIYVVQRLRVNVLTVKCGSDLMYVIC